jgi:hypothetical protein
MTHLQVFTLPQPVAFLQGGTAKLVLIGKQQQQTVGPGAGEHHDYYYTCLSHVSINGTLLGAALQQSSAVLNGRPTAAVPTVAKAAKALRASVVASFVYFNSSGESQYDDSSSVDSGASSGSEGAGCRPF